MRLIITAVLVLIILPAITSAQVNVTVDSTYSGYSPDVIDDGIIDANGGTSTTWASAESTTDPHWVLLEFPTEQPISNVTIYWAHNNQRGLLMSSQQVDVQYWDVNVHQLHLLRSQQRDLDSGNLLIWDHLFIQKYCG
jgi:hypothetical protein